jgi:alpha-glucoside transport system substrate-binding protein
MGAAHPEAHDHGMGWRARLALALVTVSMPACRAVDQVRELAGQRVEILGVWKDDEAKRFEQVLDRFSAQTGVQAVYSSTNGRDITAVLDERLAAGTAPELTFVPQPGVLQRYARSGQIRPIDDIVGPAVRRGWSAEWRRLGSVDGRLYGVWFKAAHKSLVWYSISAFERAGVVPPSDFDGLASVASAVVATGTPAFAVSGADQWTLTDWFENLYLRRAGPDRYDALADHRLAWTDPSVIDTLTLLRRLLDPPTGTGGPAGMGRTTFEQSVGLVFGADQPAAAMVAEGDFVAGAVDASTRARIGVDVDVFSFPDPDRSRRLVVGGGDAVAMVRATPASRALLSYLATPEAAEVWARLGGFASANQDVDLGAYPDPITRQIARTLLDAGDGFRFDLSDLQPPAFGATDGRGMFGILTDFVVARRDPAATAALLEEAASVAYADPLSRRRVAVASATLTPPHAGPVHRPTPASSAGEGRTS